MNLPRKEFSVLLPSVPWKDFLRARPGYHWLGAWAVASADFYPRHPDLCRGNLPCRNNRKLPSADQEGCFKKETIIVREGKPASRMFVIVSGSVDVVKYLARAWETVMAVSPAE